MAENARSVSRPVVLGLEGAWGFAPADQTSPARAAASGALVDITLSDQNVTELRIHGVSGSDGPTMLEHPTALQVAGDAVTGFYRRWSPDGKGRPSTPWKLEAYSWGGLTEAPLASASWLLLSPFMMYNLAYFMLPAARKPGTAASAAGQPSHLRRDAGHWLADLLLRLLALAATVQLVSAIASVTISTVAWQAASHQGMLPSWLGWYVTWTQGQRVAVALLAVAVAVAALWWVSVKTASRYEARESSADPKLNEMWPLTQPGFWKGSALVQRQRALHLAAACAGAAAIAALSADRTAAARPAALIIAFVALGLAATSTFLSLADRQDVTLARDQALQGRRATWWCRGVLMAGVAALAVSAAASASSVRPRPGRGVENGPPPGLTSFLVVLLAVQLALLLCLAITVGWLAVRARPTSRPPPPNADRRQFGPYLGGNLSTVLAALAFLLGGLLTAVANLGVARMLGTAVPSGFRFTTAPSNGLAVPWPVYAFVAVFVGLLAGALLAAAVLYGRYRVNSRRFGRPRRAEPSCVTAYYKDHGASSQGDDPAFKNNRRAVARVWAVGLLADGAAAAVTLIVGGGMLAVLATEGWAYHFAGPAAQPHSLSGGWWHGVASVIALLTTLLAGALVTLLRSAYTSTSDRKAIGAVWDVATFWPRAVHPLAPPCYGERAVPEVVDRIRLLAGAPTYPPNDPVALHIKAAEPDLSPTDGPAVRCGPVLLTGYSQGSIIAVAVAAQLPEELRADQFALLTLACPARRLYGRAFPAYFGWRQLDKLRKLLRSSDGERWKNLVRKSDYIGSWIFDSPEPSLADSYLRDHVDQPCWDPVVLVADEDPTPPPVHRHSGWWPDPRAARLASYLAGLLAGGEQSARLAASGTGPRKADARRACRRLLRLPSWRPWHRRRVS